MKAHKGHILQAAAKNNQLNLFEDSYLLVGDNGIIDGISSTKPAHCEIVDHKENWILPGFVDTHTHFPQFEIIGSYGEKLLEWLNTYTFPEEIKYQSQTYSSQKADIFCGNLLANGTTAAAIYSTNHLSATTEICKSTSRFGVCGWIGKASMDRNGPEELLVDADKDIEEIKELIGIVNDLEVNLAVTPRFAPTSSEKQLEALGKIKADTPGLKVQTHYAENHDEISWVAELFPKHNSYLQVYRDFGLLGKDSILGHGIHVDEDDFKILSDSGTKIAHCPTSNLFLGSGLFPKERYDHFNVEFALASDVGAGTSLSMWRTMAAAYNIQKLKGHCYTPYDLFCSATIDGADILGLNSGELKQGKQADFQVLDVLAKPSLKTRMDSLESVSDKFFAMIVMGDERLVKEVYTGGELRFQRGATVK